MRYGTLPSQLHPYQIIDLSLLTNFLSSLYLKPVRLALMRLQLQSLAH